MIQAEYDMKIRQITTYVRDRGALHVSMIPPTDTTPIKTRTETYMMYISTERRNFRCEAHYITKTVCGNDYSFTKFTVNNTELDERVKPGAAHLLQELYDVAMCQEISESLFEF